jgi:His/Glu/Gln/Arg/opine family amino acid ABC transporter permease subunit
MSGSWYLLLQGACTTLQVVACTAILSLGVGTLFGLFSSERLKCRLPFIEIVTFVLRAVPFYVQLLIVYFVLPELVGFQFNPFAASVISLGLCSSGYLSQIVRGGLNSISDAQWEAAFSLGLSRWQTIYHIILPQLFRHVLPAINNEIDSLLKSSAVISSIGMLELTRMGMNIVSREMEPIPIYLSVAALYLVMSAVFNGFARYIERRISYVRS